MARVGADFKQKVIDSMRSTWNSFYQLAMFHKQRTLEEEVDKTFQEQLEKQQEIEEETMQENATGHVSQLNKGRRVDYVLQKAPFQILNDYIFALHSHVCYWESEDTILLMLKEMYSSMGVTSDIQIPQQTMTVERTATPSSMNKVAQFQMEPTLSDNAKGGLQASRTAGFIKKT